MYGLTSFDLDIIHMACKQFPNISEAILFGSRAKGTQRPGSDVDIALKGHDLTRIALQLSTYLNQETLLPYQFDIVTYENIDNPQLVEHIDRVGIPIYKNAV